MSESNASGVLRQTQSTNGYVSFLRVIRNFRSGDTYTLASPATCVGHLVAERTPSLETLNTHAPDWLDAKQASRPIGLALPLCGPSPAEIFETTLQSLARSESTPPSTFSTSKKRPSLRQMRLLTVPLNGTGVPLTVPSTPAGLSLPALMLPSVASPVHFPASVTRSVSIW